MAVRFKPNQLLLFSTATRRKHNLCLTEVWKVSSFFYRVWVWISAGWKVEVCSKHLIKHSLDSATNGISLLWLQATINYKMVIHSQLTNVITPTHSVVILAIDSISNTPMYSDEIPNYSRNNFSVNLSIVIRWYNII